MIAVPSLEQIQRYDKILVYRLEIFHIVLVLAEIFYKRLYAELLPFSLVVSVTPSV